MTDVAPSPESPVSTVTVHESGGGARPKRKGSDAVRAHRVRKRISAGEVVPQEDRDFLDRYDADLKARGRGRRAAPASAPSASPPPPPKPPEVVDFRVAQPPPGAPAGTPAAPTAPPSKCGNPSCVHCERSIVLCPVTGKEIHPKIPLEAAATYAGMLFGGISVAVAKAFGAPVTVPGHNEILAAAPHVQEVVWRRLAGAEEYADIAALVGCVAVFTMGQVGAAHEWRKANGPVKKPDPAPPAEPPSEHAAAA